MSDYDYSDSDSDYEWSEQDKKNCIDNLVIDKRITTIQYEIVKYAMDYLECAKKVEFSIQDDLKKREIFFLDSVNYLMSMTNKKLKALLKINGMPTTGKKNELLARLLHITPDKVPKLPSKKKNKKIGFVTGIDGVSTGDHFVPMRNISTSMGVYGSNSRWNTLPVIGKINSNYTQLPFKKYLLNKSGEYIMKRGQRIYEIDFVDLEIHKILEVKHLEVWLPLDDFFSQFETSDLSISEEYFHMYENIIEVKVVDRYSSNLRSVMVGEFILDPTEYSRVLNKEDCTRHLSKDIILERLYAIESEFKENELQIFAYEQLMSYVSDHISFDPSKFSNFIDCGRRGKSKFKHSSWACLETMRLYIRKFAQNICEQISKLEEFKPGSDIRKSIKKVLKRIERRIVKGKNIFELQLLLDKLLYSIYYTYMVVGNHNLNMLAGLALYPISEVERNMVKVAVLWPEDDDQSLYLNRTSSLKSLKVLQWWSPVVHANDKRSNPPNTWKENEVLGRRITPKDVFCMTARWERYVKQRGAHMFHLPSPSLMSKIEKPATTLIEDMLHKLKPTLEKLSKQTHEQGNMLLFNIYQDRVSQDISRIISNAFNESRGASKTEEHVGFKQFIHRSLF